MTDTIEYTDDLGDGPSEHAVIMENFLPPPGEIAKAIEKQKITIMLSASSCRFFKEEAEKYGVSYQAMIRRVLDEYAQRAKK
jgi:predicted DNA binding CopG/RHH family protein